MKKYSAEKSAKLLNLEVIIGIISILIWIGTLLIPLYMDLPDTPILIIVSVSTTLFIVIMLILLRIEQKAGVYNCRLCGHKHIPTYRSVLFAPHLGRSRYIKCPKCGNRSFHYKTLD